MLKKIKCLIVILLLSAVPPAPAQSEEADWRLPDIIGRLYLNHKQLTNVYRDMHDAALTAVNGPDQQLGYIQKTYLFVSEANLIGFYQWELLAVIDYIKDTHRSDYFTLRVKDLDRAIFESKDRVISLKLYHGYITEDSPRALIDKAIGLIEANIYMYEDIIDQLKPLANPPNPFEKLVKDEVQGKRHMAEGERRKE
ncbi:MAG: hypothetical protein WAK95_14535 [Desulfobacterales bacterium]